MKKSRKKLEKDYLLKAKELISEFFFAEFCDSSWYLLEDEGDYDLERIPLAYTTTEDSRDEEHEIQVEVNLINFSINQFVDNKLFNTCKYETLKELVDNELKGLTFDNLIEIVDYTELEEFLKDK